MAKIGIVGAGISGMGAAWALNRGHEITLYEAEDRLGGHANTVDVEDALGTVAADTAFVVYTEPNYPNLVRLFEEIGVATEKSNMSFSWSLNDGEVELRGRASTVFAGPDVLFRPRVWRITRDYVRFIKTARRVLERGSDETLGQFLDREGYSKEFQDDLLLPLVASVWSIGIEPMRDFPATTMIGFLANHEVLQTGRRADWHAISGGSRAYVDRLTASFRERIRLSAPVTGVIRDEESVTVLDANGGRERYDHLVLATHSDTTLCILGEDASPREKKILGAIRYQPTQAILHRDASFMPRRRRLWCAWNYIGGPDEPGRTERPVSVTYWMNRLQNLTTADPVLVSVNPLREPREVVARFSYAHPLFDRSAVEAQSHIDEIQGERRTWFAGAWCGYGFHEDGLRSGLEVARALGSPAPWGVFPTPAIRRASPR